MFRVFFIALILWRGQANAVDLSLEKDRESTEKCDPDKIDQMIEDHLACYGEAHQMKGQW